MNRNLILFGLALLILTLATAGWVVDFLRICRRLALGERR